ncbi:unnamed protein product, partial [marine sediment metagenome]
MGLKEWLKERRDVVVEVISTPKKVLFPDAPPRFVSPPTLEREGFVPVPRGGGGRPYVPPTTPTAPGQTAISQQVLLEQQQLKAQQLAQQQSAQKQAQLQTLIQQKKQQQKFQAQRKFEAGTYATPEQKERARFKLQQKLSEAEVEFKRRRYEAGITEAPKLTKEEVLILG